MERLGTAGGRRQRGSEQGGGEDRGEARGGVRAGEPRGWGRDLGPRGWDLKGESPRMGLGGPSSGVQTRLGSQGGRRSGGDSGQVTPLRCDLPAGRARPGAPPRLRFREEDGPEPWQRAGGGVGG